MSRFPIRMRLTAVFALVMAVVLALLGAFLYLRLQSSLDEQITDDLEARGAAVASSDVDPSLLAGEEGIARVLGPEVSGQVSRVTPTSRVVLVTAAELSDARRGLVVDVEREGFRLRAEAIEGGRVIVLGKSLEDRDEALQALLAQLGIALPLALLVASAIGYFVAGAALRPVEAIGRGAAEISSERPGRRLPLPRAHDEIRRLAETLNEMLDRLDEGLARERRLVADASHELRTPLAALRTELELARRRPRTQQELEAALESATEEVERLVRLAEDLLVLARADENALPLRVSEWPASELLVEVAGRNVQRAAAEGRAVATSAPDHLVAVADRERVEQALDVLVDNALRHGSGHVCLSARAGTGSVVLGVSDEGAGFPPEFLPHAFERFSRADVARAGGGAGLGLAIVDAIARVHGGSAGAANRPGGGVDVWLALPDRLNDGDAARGDSGDVG